MGSFLPIQFKNALVGTIRQTNLRMIIGTKIRVGESVRNYEKLRVLACLYIWERHGDSYREEGRGKNKNGIIKDEQKVSPK